jgi:hypothetical protein
LLAEIVTYAELYKVWRPLYYSVCSHHFAFVQLDVFGPASEIALLREPYAASPSNFYTIEVGTRKA